MVFNDFLKIENEIIHLKVIKDSRVKKIILSVIPQEYCMVKSPPYVSEEYLKNFISRNKKWILEKFNESEKYPVKPPAFTEGEKIFFKGDLLTLKITNTVSECAVSNSNTLLMPDQADKMHFLNLFYLKESIRETEKYRIKYKNLTMPVKKFRIRHLSSRWGSCSKALSISLNCRLILAPEIIFEYVFVHEAVHLNNMSHNKKFWTAIEDILPDYRKRKQWLKEHSAFMMNYPEQVRKNKYNAVITCRQ